MIQIANPIYDTVFKYLMKDKKVAKLLLSAIIGKEVVKLDFRPTEHNLTLGQSLAVLRMDFAARVRDGKGQEELIILELQKAKLPSDIMRFRKYLGEQYCNKDNVKSSAEGEDLHPKALPILSIYILGHPLDHIKAPVLRVNRRYTDAATGEELMAREEFVECLTHDSIIIQVRQLAGKRRNELEKLLAVFDQSKATKDQHILNIKEEELPERHRPMIRRLQKAIANSEIRSNMDAEDNIIEDIQNYQRLIDKKEELLAEKDEQISKKDEQISKKDEEISKKDEEVLKSKEIIENVVINMYRQGNTAQQISKVFGLTIEEIQEIIGKK